MRNYFELTKPRMVAMNVIVAAAAFVFASSPIDWGKLGMMALGISLIVASACVFNNYFDRHIDAKMERTKNRTLAAGRLAPGNALVFGAVLLLCGVVVMSQIHTLALLCALAGFILYVYCYTPLKHYSSYALYAGALAGATPPLVGYAAAANSLDAYAWALFVFLFLWQIPHFLAIAVYRSEEYAAADIPLLIPARPYSEKEKRIARAIFHSSLVLLILFCLLLIVQR